MRSLAQHNHPHLVRLAELLGRGRVYAIIGAGSSIACGYPGWNGFLTSMEQALRGTVRTDVLKALRARDPRTRADEMGKLLGQRFPEIFHETFRPRGDGTNTPEWIRLLFDLNLSLLMTTNYTNELEGAARFHPSLPLGSKPRAVSWHDSKALNGALRRTHGSLELLYMHGRWNESPETILDSHDRSWSRVILGEESYKYAYEHPADVATALKTACSSSTLLIVGASLADEDFKGVLREVLAKVGSQSEPHYVILPTDHSNTPSARESDLLDLYGLQAILYEAGGPERTRPDRGLEVLLRNLVAMVDRLAPVRIATSVPPPGASPFTRQRVVHPLPRASVFQPRPQYQAPIENFLARPEGGVLALVGIGGSGKTALVREAILPLQTSHEEDPEVTGLFVWSFYDEPDPSEFMRSLADYVTGSSPTVSLSNAALVWSIQRACAKKTKLLIVLDGLETIQASTADAAEEGDTPGFEPSDRSEFDSLPRIHGALENAFVGELLTWLATSSTLVKGIITTRFPIPSLVDKGNDGRIVILNLDSLTRYQARALLRQRGVRKGSDEDLNDLLDHFGAHALTVDHLGGVIATYLDGDPRRFRELSDRELTRFKSGQTDVRLASVIEAYQRYIGREDPTVQSALRLLAVFTRPVSADLLVEAFSLSGEYKGDGQSARSSLRRSIKRLLDLGLVSEEQINQIKVYTLHPSLRQNVLIGMGNEKASFTTVARSSLENQLSAVTGDPKSKLVEGLTLDLAEDLIRLCLESGDNAHAHDMYVNRLGGYEHLGLSLGDFRRGERITRMLLRSAESLGSRSRGLDFVSNSSSHLVWPRNECGLYLTVLGRLEEASQLFRSNIGPPIEESASEGKLLSAYYDNLVNRNNEYFVAGYYLDNMRNYGIPTTLRENLMWSLLLRGRLLEAEALASKMLKKADALDFVARASAFYWRASVRLRRGQVADGLRDLRSLKRQWWLSSGYRGPLVGRAGFEFCELLLRMGKATDAQRMGEVLLRREAGGHLAPNAYGRIVLAEAHRQLGHFERCDESLFVAKEKCLKSNNAEDLLCCRLIHSKRLVDKGEESLALQEISSGLYAAEAMGFDCFRIEFQLAHASLMVAGGHLDEAERLARAAEQFARDPERHYLWGVLGAQELLAAVHLARGEVGEATQYRTAAMELRNRVSAREDILRELTPQADRFETRRDPPR